jgi:YD repeat-containing protein
VTTETDPGGFQIGYGYDALGRRTSITDPDANVTGYHYASAPGVLLDVPNPQVPVPVLFLASLLSSLTFAA